MFAWTREGPVRDGCASINGGRLAGPAWMCRHSCKLFVQLVGIHAPLKVPKDKAASVVRQSLTLLIVVTSVQFDLCDHKHILPRHVQLVRQCPHGVHSHAEDDTPATQSPFFGRSPFIERVLPELVLSVGHRQSLLVRCRLRAEGQRRGP